MLDKARADLLGSNGEYNFYPRGLGAYFWDRHGSVSPEIAAGLLVQGERIKAAKIPRSKLDKSINVTVWNIREFDPGPRAGAQYSLQPVWWRGGDWSRGPSLLRRERRTRDH